MRKRIAIAFAISIGYMSFIGLQAANTIQNNKVFDLFKTTNLYKRGEGRFQPIDAKVFAHTKIDQILIKVKGRNQMFNVFLAPNGSFIIGRAFSKNGKPLLFKAQLPKAFNMKIQEKKEAYAIGSGKKNYYVFTDPICPFCAGLEAFMPKLEKIGRFHIFFFPLDSLHPTARRAAAYVMSLPKDKRAEAVQKIMIDKDKGFLKEKVAHKFFDEVKEQQAVGNILKVRGTPSIYDRKGFPVNTDILLRRIKVSGQDFMNKVRELASRERASKSIPPIPIVEKKISVKALKLLDRKDISIKLGSGKKDLYVFMSTQCPHCKKMFKSKKMAALLKKYTIHFIVSPLPGNIESKYETAYLYNLKDKARAKIFQEMMLGKKKLTDKDKLQLEKIVQNDNGKIAAKIGITNIILSQQHINAVPTIVTSDGTIISTMSF